MIQETDRDRRLQLQIFLALVQLLLMQAGRVVQDAFFVIRKREHLHLDVEEAPRLIAGFDVEDRQLVVECFFEVKGVEQLDIPDLVARLRTQDAVQDINQDRPGGLPAQQVLERVIDLGINVQNHPFRSVLENRAKSPVNVEENR